MPTRGTWLLNNACRGKRQGSLDQASSSMLSCTLGRTLPVLCHQQGQPALRASPRCSGTTPDIHQRDTSISYDLLDPSVPRSVPCPTAETHSVTLADTWREATGSPTSRTAVSFMTILSHVHQRHHRRANCECAVDSRGSSWGTTKGNTAPTWSRTHHMHGDTLGKKTDLPRWRKTAFKSSCHDRCRIQRQRHKCASTMYLAACVVCVTMSPNSITMPVSCRDGDLCGSTTAVVVCGPQLGDGLFPLWSLGELRIQRGRKCPSTTRGRGHCVRRRTPRSERRKSVRQCIFQCL